jgi:predicted metal-dependent HD superfamily phosphohydrolase
VKQIRQEYIHLDELVFRKERARVLNKLLNNGNIYRNGDFKKRYETKAVQNIQRELLSLLENVK